MPRRARRSPRSAPRRRRSGSKIERARPRRRPRRVTPCTSSSDRTTCTSLMSGTSRSTLVVSPSSAATIAFVARFFAPLTSTRPRERPCRRGSRGSLRTIPVSLPSVSAVTLRSDFIRWTSLVSSRAWLADGLRPCGAAVLAYGTGSVRGRHASRRASNCAILSSLRSVSPMSSSPSRSRHLV